MGLLDRTSDLVNRRVNRLLDGLEDDAASAAYDDERLREELGRVDDALTDLVTERKRLESRRADVEERVETANEEAREAVAAGREDEAREVLRRKQADVRRLEEVDDGIEELREAESELKTRRTELAKRVDRVRATRAERDARRRTAEAEATVSEALSGDPAEESGEAGRRAAGAADAVDEAEARAAALEELRAEGFFDDEDVEAQLARERTDDAVEAELDTLRREVRGDDADDDGDSGGDGTGGRDDEGR
jgi:phage shock protein A